MLLQRFAGFSGAAADTVARDAVDFMRDDLGLARLEIPAGKNPAIGNFFDFFFGYFD